jgi:hypothetical protein
MSEVTTEQPGCPLSPEFLPPNARKHVDPKAPVPLRMMAAKGLVPLSPGDMLGLLFMLTFDSDPQVKESAAKTASTLPDRILSVALRDEGVKAPVLGYFVGLFGSQDTYAEMLILNPNTPDGAVAGMAAGCTVKIAELIGQNQLRLLRYDEIVRRLCQNPNAPLALIDSVCDFAVRSGLQLLDVPQMQAARVRIFGPQAIQAPPDPGPTASELLGEFQELAEDTGRPIEEKSGST